MRLLSRTRPTLAMATIAVPLIFAHSGSAQNTAPSQLADTSGQQAAMTVVQAVVSSNAPGSCPVGFSVKRSSGSALRNAAPNGAKVGALRYEFSFGATGSGLGGSSKAEHSGIARVVVSAHGFTGPHTEPVQGQVRDAAEGDALTPAYGRQGTEAFTFQPEQAGAHAFRSVAFTRKLTSVNWVDLVEVKYSDGTTWTAPAEGSCRAEPNGFLPVAVSR